MFFFYQSFHSIWLRTNKTVFDFQVSNLRLPRESEGKLRGFGYVDFEDRDSLVAAMNILDLVSLHIFHKILSYFTTAMNPILIGFVHQIYILRLNHILYVIIYSWFIVKKFSWLQYNEWLIMQILRM